MSLVRVQPGELLNPERLCGPDTFGAVFFDLEGSQMIVRYHSRTGNNHLAREYRAALNELAERLSGSQ